MQIHKLELANNIRTSTLGFTEDQRKAYDELIAFINAPYSDSDYKRALIGAAGTGKTYLIKALITNCNMNYSMIGLAAPTHKACRVLQSSIGLNKQVNTIASDMGYALNLDLDNIDINNPAFAPKRPNKITNYRLYIIDEASMLPHNLISHKTKGLEAKCKEYKCKIIYVGDGSQLAPVKEHVSSAFSGIRKVELNQIVRQEDDNPIRDLLNLLRGDIRNRTTNFISYIGRNKEKFDSGNVKGFRVCSNAEFINLIDVNFSDEQITNNVDFVKIVAYTNHAVNDWNRYVRTKNVADVDKGIINRNDLIMSYQSLVDKFSSFIIKNSEEYIINDIVNYVHPKYNIKGFLVKFQAIHGGQISSPVFIVDHTNRESIVMFYEIANSLINKAKQARASFRTAYWKDYYSFKEGCLLLTDINDKFGKTIFRRDLDYGFALTAHKSQGSTFDTVFVDVNDIIYDRFGHPYPDINETNRRLYVACSRAKNKLYLRFGV